MSKKITITLSDKAEEYFNEVMYSLPKNDDGTGMCTQNQAINHVLEAAYDFEQTQGIDILGFIYCRDNEEKLNNEIW